MTDESHQKRIKGIFASALEFDMDRRVSFLDEACGSDAHLRLEVESWLASYHESEDFIETPLLSVGSLLDQPSPMAGRHFGNFEIIREIGSGGMGAVYLAKRTDGEFNQEVALKIVRQSIAENQLIERFRRERQILASLNHPNIAKLLDGGISEEGLPFFAMEYIDGESITEFANSRKLDLEARLRLFLKVCSAVAYAHRNLVVHRDLKPGNILVNKDGEPKLLDFGLAKLVDINMLTDSTRTQTAFRALTPAYASPEQLKNEPLTTASDIYSLGVVFYELLSGQRPFRSEGKTIGQIINTVSGTAPSPPSSNLKSANGDLQLKGDIDNIALMALRNEADRRYATVDQFADDIDRHLKGRPVSARPNTYRYRASKYLKRHRIGVAAAFLVSVSLISGIAISLWQARQARLEKAKAEAVSVFMQGMLNSSGPGSTLQSAGHELTVKEVLDEASKRLAADNLRNQPEVRAELQRIIGSSYVSLGQYDLAEQNLTYALQAQTEIYGEGHLEVLKTMVLVGELWVIRGDNGKAAEFYRQSIPKLRSLQKNGSIEARYLFSSLADFALVVRAQGDSLGAEMLLREGLLLEPQLTADDRVNLSIQKMVLALTLADQGKFDEAEKMVLAEAESIRQQDGERSVAMGVTLRGLGSLQMEQGRLTESEQSLSEAEINTRKLLNQANLQLGDNLRLQAQLYFLQKRYGDAEEKIDETLQIYRAGTTAKYVNFATALMIQGLIFSRTGRVAEGEKLLREAVQIRTENMPPSHFLLATANGALGEFLTQQKRFAEAEPLLLSSHDSLKASQAPQSPRIQAAARRLLDLYTKWNKPEFAAKYAQE